MMDLLLNIFYETYILYVIIFLLNQMAKLYHPDLNPTIPSHNCQNRMTEIINAYQKLMDSKTGLTGGSKVGDSRVALACEIMTLVELKEDLIHDVHNIRILYNSDMRTEKKTDLKCEKISIASDLSTQSILEATVHPDDSISDVKRILQDRYLEDWGLAGRRKDRDKIATGWELVCQQSGTKGMKDHESSLHVMSYHLFLHTYSVQHGDIIYAVVRKNE